MVNYSFTTDQGWKVSWPIAFSPSYAILHTPCMADYQSPDYLTSKARNTRNTAGAYAPAAGDDLLGQLTSRQLTFESYSTDVLRQLLEERVAIRDRNRSSILGRISDVSGEIYGASLLHTPDSYKRRQGLEKTKLDLERDLRETDERLWKDTSEVRQLLVEKSGRLAGTSLRSKLFSSDSLHDDNYEGQGFSGLSDKV